MALNEFGQYFITAGIETLTVPPPGLDPVGGGTIQISGTAGTFQSTFWSNDSDGYTWMEVDGSGNYETVGNVTTSLPGQNPTVAYDAPDYVLLYVTSGGLAGDYIVVMNAAGDTIPAGETGTIDLTDTQGDFNTVVGGVPVAAHPSGQQVFINNGQLYYTPVADTVIAGAGNETAWSTSTGMVLFAGPGSAVGTNATEAVAAPGAAISVSAFGGSSLTTLFTGGACVLFGGGTNAPTANTLVTTSPSTGAATISGASDTIWASSATTLLIPDGASIPFFMFDVGSTNSTIVSQVSPPNIKGFPLDITTGYAFVSNGGSLTYVGGDEATIVAGSGSTTINAAQATGKMLYSLGPGSASVTGGSSDEMFLGGPGSATINAGAAGNNQVTVGSGVSGVGGLHNILVDIKTLLLGNGYAGGSELLQGWTSLDQVDLFGYGPNPIASQSVVQGSLKLILTDNTQITFAGVTDVSSLQINSY